MQFDACIAYNKSALTTFRLRQTKMRLQSKEESGLSKTVHAQMKSACWVSSAKVKWVDRMNRHLWTHTSDNFCQELAGLGERGAHDLYKAG